MGDFIRAGGEPGPDWAPRRRDREEVVELWRDPVFNQECPRVPRALAARLEAMAEQIPRNIYYERMGALLAVAGGADHLDPEGFLLDEPPSDDELQFGAVLGQAFHQGCSLADVALAADVAADTLVEIGKRTIKRKKWLERI